MIAHGHSHQAILGYTLRQYNGYLVRSFARDRRERRDRILDLRAAIVGGDAFAKHLKALTT